MVSISGPPKGQALGLLLGWWLVVLQMQASLWTLSHPTEETKCSWRIIARFTVATGRWDVLVKSEG